MIWLASFDSEFEFTIRGGTKNNNRRLQVLPLSLKRRATQAKYQGEM